MEVIAVLTMPVYLYTGIERFKDCIYPVTPTSDGLVPADEFAANDALMSEAVRSPAPMSSDRANATC